MIILGVDPGTKFTGYGVIENNNNTFKKIINGTIKLPSNKDIPLKLKIIYDDLCKIIKKYKPDEFAIETAFYGKNVQSALKIGYARGVAILAAVHFEIPTGEYSPREIKKSVTGKGSASKEQVSYMIKTLLKIKEEQMRLDESDALAVAICHSFRMKSFPKKMYNWKSYVEAFPEKIINY
jgi:crossover junction endodeoxyribonuclease RuvC